MQYRQHQQDLIDSLGKWKSGFPLKVLCHVVPGGGKSFLPYLAWKQFPSLKIAWFAPRLSLLRQAARDYQEMFGLELRETTGVVNPCRGKHGFIATHQSLQTTPDLFLQELDLNDYLVVFDEVHHAKVDKPDRRRPLASAISQASYKIRLDMTGTLSTNDNAFIEGVDYQESPSGFVPDPQSSADIFIRYTRLTALRERAVCRMEFYRHDGEVRYVDEEGIKKVKLSAKKNLRQDRDALFCALRTKVAQQLFDEGVKHWRKYGEKLIVVTDSQKTAKKYHKDLCGQGVDAALAIQDNPEATRQVSRFRESSNCTAMVTCQMAYEGLDVKEATHLVCLTHIRSYPWIEQMLGRIWRWMPGKDRCWAFVPDDIRMSKVIVKIRSEEQQVIGLPGDGPERGESRDEVVAVSGNVDRVTVESLDGDLGVEEFRAQLKGLLSKHGVHSEDVQSEVAGIVEKLKEKRLVSGSLVETVSDREKRYRSEIQRLCNQANNIRIKRLGIQQVSRDDRSFYQLELRKRSGKSTTAMGEDELLAASSIALALYQFEKAAQEGRRV